MVNVGSYSKMASNNVAFVWITLVFLSLSVEVTDSEEPAKEDSTVNWLDAFNKAGTSFEFKFEIGAGREECFYQKLYMKSQVFLSYEILKGGDRNIDFFFRSPDGTIVDQKLWKTDGTLEYTTPGDGIYEICFDNSYSRFGTKLVYFFFSSFVQEHWDKYVNELEQLDGTFANFSIYLEKVQTNIRDAVIHQSSSRMYVMLDYYTIMGNNKYVQYWSILQCIIIISTTCLQVFFLRRLFNTKNVTPSMKPRA